MEQGRRRYGGGGVASAAAAVDSGDGRSRAGSSTQPVTVLRLDEIPLLADVPPAKKRILAQAFGAHHHRVRHLIRVVSLSSRGLGGARGAVTRSYEPGEVLIQQGDTGDMFFILQSGTVSVLQHDAATGVEQLLGTLEPPGASFGELALIKVRN
jgi:CRP-like cAMP-binding protein